MKLPVGQGITGWVAEHREPVAVGSEAFKDSRFQSFNELPEDRYEAFLSVPILCRNKLVGVINLQHRRAHTHSEAEIQLISTIGFLVGAEVEMARLEEENSQLSEELSRASVERGKGFCSAICGQRGRGLFDAANRPAAAVVSAKWRSHYFEPGD